VAFELLRRIKMLISKFDTKNIEDNIMKFEEKYNFEFPKQYRDFLKKYNGGMTPDTNFKMNRISSDIRGFYGFENADEDYNYKGIEGLISFCEFLNDNMLLIGTNDFGDYILLGIGSENNGKIFFCYHDRKKSYKELAEDFKTFVGSCKSKKIGHVRTVEERRQGMIDRGYGSYVSPVTLKGWQAEIDLYSNIVQEELILE